LKTGKNNMNLDRQLYKLPIIGFVIRRLYTYFKKHTAVTDFMHISLGLGIGLLFAREKFFTWAIVFLAIGIVGHVYAFIKGGN